VRVAESTAAVAGSLQEVVQHSVEHCSEVRLLEKSWLDNLEAMRVVAGILEWKEQMSVLVLVEVPMLEPVGVQPLVVEEATSAYLGSASGTRVPITLCVGQHQLGCARTCSVLC